MTTKLGFASDIQGYNSYAPPPSNTMYRVQLAASGNATLTLPTDSANWIIAFASTPGSEIWVAYNTTAVAPSTGAFVASTSEMNPGARVVPSTVTTVSGTTATTINLLNNGASTANIWIGLYAKS